MTWKTYKNIILSNFEETSKELNQSSQIISDDDIGLISSLSRLKNSIDKISKHNSQKASIPYLREYYQ